MVNSEFNNLTVTSSIGDGVESTGVGEQFTASFLGFQNWAGWWWWEGAAEASSEASTLLWWWSTESSSETATEATATWQWACVDADVVEMAVAATNKSCDVLARWNCALEGSGAVTTCYELFALVGTDLELLENSIVET